MDSVACVHQQIEAMKIAVHTADERFADRDAMFLSPEELLEPGSLARAAQGIGFQLRHFRRCRCPWVMTPSTSRQRMLRA